MARIACSGPAGPRQRRPGQSPCLPRMKRRAHWRSIVNMTVSCSAWFPGLQGFVDIKDIVLRRGLDAKIVKYSEELGAMIRAVIRHMQ